MTDILGGVPWSSFDKSVDKPRNKLSKWWGAEAFSHEGMPAAGSSTFGNWSDIFNRSYEP